MVTSHSRNSRTSSRILEVTMRSGPQNSTIEPWNEGTNSRTKPLRLESTMPTGKQKIDKKYVEQLKISWAASNTATELRFILGHKEKIQAYLTNKEVGGS